MDVFILLFFGAKEHTCCAWQASLGRSTMKIAVLTLRDSWFLPFLCILCEFTTKVGYFEAWRGFFSEEKS